MKEIETAEAAAMVSVMAAAVMAAEIEDGVERQFAHSMASCRLTAHGHCLWARDCLWRHDNVAHSSAHSAGHRLACSAPLCTCIHC